MVPQGRIRICTCDVDAVQSIALIGVNVLGNMSR